MGADHVDLSEAIDLVEGLIFGSIPLNIADPELGLTRPEGLFLGSPLTSDKFIKDMEAVVWRPVSRNAGGDRDSTETMANDTIMTALSVALPKTGDQRAKRKVAYLLDRKIRGLALSAGPLQQRGLDMFWVQTTERGALWPDPLGYGRYGHLVIESTYRMVRIESLTGGPN